MEDQKVNHLANLLGLPKWTIKEAAGIPLKLCNAKSVDEAKAKYHDSKERSEEERAAFLKWDELANEVALKVNDFEAAVAAYHRAPKNGQAQKTALKKMFELCP